MHYPLRRISGAVKGDSMEPMLQLTITQIQNIFLLTMVTVIALILIVAYFLTEKHYRNYVLSLMFLLGFLIALVLAPMPFQFIFLLGFLIILINIIFHTVFPRFFFVDEEKFLVYKHPQVWSQFKTPPESKEEKK